MGALFSAFSGDDPFFAISSGLLPSAIGLGLLVTAVGIARGSRLASWAGMVAAVGFIGLAILFIVNVLPDIDKGPFNFVLPAIVVAGVLGAISAAYAATLWRARRGLAPGWQPQDRPVGIRLGAIAVASVALSVGTNALAINAAHEQATSQADARALATATTLEVLVFDAALAPTPDGTSTVVDRLTLGVNIVSPEAYALVDTPTLCLTDEATFRHEVYKPGIVCWGVPGPAESLRDALEGGIPGDMASIQLQLRAAGSPCAFEPGLWHAQLSLLPDVGGAGPGGERFMIDTTFEVSAATATTAPAGDSTVEVGADCLLSP